MEVNASLPEMDVLHYSTDLDDPSAGLTVAWHGFQLHLLASMNNPAPLPVQPSMSAIARKRSMLTPDTAFLWFQWSKHQTKF